MSDTRFVLGQLHREERDDPWHGPSMDAVLAGIDAHAAHRRPLPGAHTIWEIVLHLTSWTREVTRRLREGVPCEPEDGDWPAVPDDASDDAWALALARLRASQEDLQHAIETFPPERLHTSVGESRVPALGTGVTYLEMLHGLVQHDVYHA